MRALNESMDSKKNASMSLTELESYFDGNICRCTGYKPIIKAFSSFCCNKPCDSTCDSVAATGKGCCTDVEDVAGYVPSCSGSIELGKVGVGAKSRPLGGGSDSAAAEFVATYTPTPLHFFNATTGKRWLRPISLSQLSATLNEFREDTVQLVVGNTSSGVTKYFNHTAPYHTSDSYTVYIDVTFIPQLITHGFDAASRELTLGAAISLNNIVALLRQYGSASTSDVDHSSVFSVAANHLNLVANTQVQFTDPCVSTIESGDSRSRSSLSA